MCKIIPWMIEDCYLFECRLVTISRHSFNHTNNPNNFLSFNLTNSSKFGLCCRTNNCFNWKATNNLSWNSPIILNSSLLNETNYSSMLIANSRYSSFDQQNNYIHILKHIHIHIHIHIHKQMNNKINHLIDNDSREVVWWLRLHCENESKKWIVYETRVNNMIDYQS
jgi:hypothetical protein